MQQVPKHAAALEIVLEHPDLATDPVLLCSAARVCTSWRTAVAASGAGTTDVVWSASCSDASGDVLLQRLASFVSWFQVHAHLVRSLRWVDFRHQSAAQREVANLLLAQGLQLAAAGPKPPRLQSFESDTISTHLLAALPDNVTELQLEFCDECDLQPDMLTAACHRLHKLQQLSLWLSNCPHESEEPPTLSVSFLPHLTLLTKLSLTCELLEVEWQNLQQALPNLQSLGDLYLDVFPYVEDGHAPHGIDMGALTGVTKLFLKLHCCFNGVGTSLPPMTEELVLMPVALRESGIDTPSPVGSLKLTSLQRLRCLEVRAACLSSYEGFGTQLQQLTQLQELSLNYLNEAEAAVNDAGTWRSLPKLSMLSIGFNYAPVRMRSTWCGPFVAGLRGATALTHLEVHVQAAAVPEQDADFGGLFGSIGCMKGLQHLSLSCAALRFYSGESNMLRTLACRFNPREAEQLSTLQQLTHLELAGFGRAVGDAVAVSLSLSLSELRTLDLRNCDLLTDAVLPVLKLMRHLTHVNLSDNPLVDTSGFKAAAASGGCPWLVGFSSSVQPAAEPEDPSGDEGVQVAEGLDSDDMQGGAAADDNDGMIDLFGF